MGKPFCALLSSQAKKNEKSRINLCKLSKLGQPVHISLRPEVNPCMSWKRILFHSTHTYTTLRSSLPPPDRAATIYSCCSPVICSHALPIGIEERSSTGTYGCVRLRSYIFQLAQHPALQLKVATRTSGMQSGLSRSA